VDHEVPPQAGNDHPTNVPMGVFPTSDGYINIAPMGYMWAKVCGLLGLDDMVDHPDFTTSEARFDNRAAVNAAIEAVTPRKTCAEWIELLNEGGIPCGPIYTLDQTFDDPQVRHLGVAQPVTSPVRGEIEVVGQPIHMSRTPNHVAAPAPEYGEHTDEVLQSLGYSDQDVADLHDRGVV